MNKYNFYMAKYPLHIVDNEFCEEYDTDAYFLDHEEAAKYLDDETRRGNIITITGPFEWVPADDVPYNLEGWFDVKYEERRFWQRYLDGELGIVPLGIIK